MRVRIEQDYARLREDAYRKIGDGAQIDAFAKALAEIIDAVPDLDGPGVREARAMIERRDAVKAAIPKPIAKENGKHDGNT